MKDVDRTVPHLRPDRPVRSLSLEVVRGPDKGMTWSGPSELVSIGTAEDNHLVLTDETVSRYHVELSPQGDQVALADHGSTNGTAVGSARIERGTVSRGTVLTLGRSLVKVRDGEEMEVELFEQDEFHGLYGRSPVMRKLMAQLDKVARSHVSAVLLGETGTGKEVVARALHQASARASKPLEVVDCGALMPSLVESELFGHEKGAFTGAHQQYVGAFERADGGTIFLDEIGELTPDLQTRLLGVLERRAFRRVGGTRPIEVDVRVIAATHRDLRDRVNTGEFRQDLYYRIAVAKLRIPPLRERVEDIELLARHFVQGMDVDKPLHQVLPHETLLSLTRYQWPGNVRELRNFVEAAVAFDDVEVPEGLEDGAPAPAGDGNAAWSRYFELPYRSARDHAVADFQRAYLANLLERHEGNVTRLAEAAQMNRPHLIQILKRIGLR